MKQNRILPFFVVLACSLGLLFMGCDNNPLPDWEDPWPTGGEAPTISSAAPDSGEVGDSVALSGSNFNGTDPDYNFVMIGLGRGQYLCDVSSASATGLTIEIPSGANNLPFTEQTILDTIMGQFAAYPDSEIDEIDTIRNAADTADSLYDTSWTVYEAAETVTKTMELTTAFEIKLSARGAELWSNKLSFKLIPPATSYRWPTLVVLD